MASLHVHPPVAGEPMLPADSIAVETDAGIVGNTRYWQRQSLVPLAGRVVRVGGAVLHITAPRDPCHKMDKIAPGLRERMTNDKQGVLAVVVQSGTIKNGDAIQPIN